MISNIITINMAGTFGKDQQSCDECGVDCSKNNTHDTSRYTVRKTLCPNCAISSANSILDIHVSRSTQRCSEHRHRDVILYCVRCRRPICDVCVHLTHSGHEYRDIRMVIEEKREEATTLCSKTTLRLQELEQDRRVVEDCAEQISKRFDRLRYAVLVRVEEQSRSLDEDRCIAARKIEQRAKEEKLKIDRWKDNRLAEIREEKEAKMREIQQKQSVLLQELKDIKKKLLDPLDDIRDQIDKADEIMTHAKEGAQKVLTCDLIESPITSNSQLESCLSMELDNETVEMVSGIAASVKFEPDGVRETRCLLGRFVTTVPAWCKLHTIQVGLRNVRLLNATKANNRVTFTCENGDDSYGLYTMNVGNGQTKLVSSDRSSVTDATSLSLGLMAVTRTDRPVINVWDTKTGKVTRYIKVPRNWSHTRLGLDRDGILYARDHASNNSKINGYRTNTGEKVRSVPYAGTIYGLATLSTGSLVIQSAATELVIMDALGTITAKITHERWQWARYAVAHDDTVFVAYGQKDDPTSIFVDSYSTGGELIERIMKHRCTPSLDHIAVVVTTSGRIVLQNGQDLVIYERLIPLLPVNDDVNLTSPRTSSSSPRTRRHIFMCIPT